MSNSYLNIVTFLLTTLFYYLALKPPIKLDQFINPDEYKKYVSNNYRYLGVYLFLVMIIQFIVNASIITSTCGGSVSENMGAAGMFTFIPWLLIFGVLIIVLTIYPGFKTAFSDVIGYFYVSGSANKILIDLLIDKDIQKGLNSDTQSSPEKKQAMEDAAEAILKICGNTSILINQIVPDNFLEYWNILKPLMKPKYQSDNQESLDLKNKLFEIVVTRDNVGEAMWFLYTGILITSIVQLKISSRGCVTTAATMEKNYKQFLDSEEEAKAKQSQSTSAVYTVG